MFPTLEDIADEYNENVYAWLTNCNNSLFDSIDINQLRWDEKRQAWRFRDITGAYWTPPSIKGQRYGEKAEILNDKPAKIAELLAYHWWIR